MTIKEYLGSILNYKDYKIEDHVLITCWRNGYLINVVIKIISPQWVKILIVYSKELKFFRIDVLASRYIYFSVTNVTKQ